MGREVGMMSGEGSSSEVKKQLKRDLMIPRDQGDCMLMGELGKLVRERTINSP